MQRGDPVEAWHDPSKAALADRHQRRRLVALLNDPKLDGPRLVARLREFGALEDVSACSAALEFLTGLRLPESGAGELLAELARCRTDMATRLGRDPGLVVAAADHLGDTGVLRAPAMVETSRLERADRDVGRDPLTDRMDRQSFELRAAKEIRRSRRFASALALVVFDLDSFQPVNDVYGHDLGDRVLREAGHLIGRTIRESDVAGRTGGDEFSVIQPATTRLGAFVAAERVRARLAARFSERAVSGRLVAMTVSGGVACFPSDGETVGELLASARRGLQRVKVRGGNEVVMHPAEKRQAVRWPARRRGHASIARRPGGDSHRARMIEISERGALVEAEASYRPAESVALSVAAEDGAHSVSCRVMRVEEQAGAGSSRLALLFDRPIAASVLARHAESRMVARYASGGVD